MDMNIQQKGVNNVVSNFLFDHGVKIDRNLLETQELNSSLWMFTGNTTATVELLVVQITVKSQ